jgi:hypothetical protein
MEYNINGKIFLKKGGRYVPKMVDGGTEMKNTYYTGTYGNLNPNKPNYGADEEDDDTDNNSKRNWSMALDMASVGLNSLANKPNPGTSARANAMSQAYTKGQGIEKTGAGILGAAALADPTGTMKIVDSAVKAGRALGNVIDPGDEYGISKSNAAKVTSSILDPLGRIQQSFNIGKRHGFGQGLKDFATAGISGNNLMKQDVQRMENKDENEDMRMRQGMNQGVYRNDSVYAKMGAKIKPYYTNKEPNVEIEDGEIVLGNPTQIGIIGDARTSLESKYGAMFHGDKHGEDSDKDGLEGIPLTSGEAYVASEHLGLNGKKSGPGNKSVANEMKPYLKFLNGGETNPMDPYKNNPVAIKETNRQLGLLKNEAEKGKFLEGINKELKNKDRSVKDILSYISQNAPMEDLNAEEQGQVSEITNQLNNSQNQNQQMYNQPAYRFGGHYMQQGGMAQPEMNPSQDRMGELVQQTPTLDPTQGGQVQLSPEAQQMLQQLPPEVQQQIMSLPVEQQEAAIMQAMQGMEGGAPPQQGAPMDPSMDPAMQGAPQDPSMVDPAAAEMGMEQGQPVMKCGGRMYRNGDYIRMQMGGQVRAGRLNGMNPMTGAFNLQ